MVAAAKEGSSFIDRFLVDHGMKRRKKKRPNRVEANSAEIHVTSNSLGSLQTNRKEKESPSARMEHCRIFFFFFIGGGKFLFLLCPTRDFKAILNHFFGLVGDEDDDDDDRECRCLVKCQTGELSKV